MKKIGLIVLSLLAVFGLSACKTDTEESNEDIIYVNAENNDEGNGYSWDNAFNDLQDALLIAESGQEIWVAEGTYYPSSTDDATEYYQMLDDVDLYGGFNGTETSFEERDYENNVTVLSGDIGVKGDSSDNSNHIIIAANSTIDGFTITDANSMVDMMMPPSGDMPDGDMPDGEEPDSSGGSDVGHSSPDEVNSGDATTTSNGAGIVIWEVAPTIANCKITNNSSGKGGGVYIIGTSELDSLPTFLNVTFEGNSAMARGGAVAIDMNSSAIFIDTVFIDNSTEGKGGAIYNDFGGSPYLYNCLFVDNVAGSGAALGNDGASNPIVAKSTFYNNTADQGGAALYQGTGPFNDPVVLDSIIWDNNSSEDIASIYSWNESNPLVYNSIVEGGYNGDNILDIDPLFVDAENGDYSLSEGSDALTLSTTGEAVGYDASVIETRTSEDYEVIIEYLYAVELNAEPTVLDLTNPLLSEDVSSYDGVIYVSVNGTGNGTSWTDATSDLQEAIYLANTIYTNSEIITEIWVSEGTYYTGTERSDSFYLADGVSIYGGFSGTETSITERDTELYVTVLSGDIGVIGDMTDNSYHVLIGADNVVIDGLTISDGYADAVNGEVYDNKGGGLLNYAAGNRVPPHTEPTLGFDITIVDCMFTNNYAEEGGAVYTYHGGNPVYEDVEFVNNSALSGGAVIDRAGVNSTYTDCLFEGNTAVYKGGAVFVDYGSMASFYNTEFSDNIAGTAGGAIYLIDRASQAVPNETSFDLIDATWELTTDIYSATYIENSTFISNEAGTSGGAIYAYEGSYVKLVSSIFTDNDAVIAADAVGTYYGSHLIVDESTSFEDFANDVVEGK